LELAAICDTNEETGKALAQKYGCSYFNNAETMLLESGADIVDICVPTFLHKQNILLAAKHKKHIVCEKPVTLTLEDMDDILDAVKQAGVKFMAAQVIRFWPEYAAIKRMYDNGEFGNIKMVAANRLAQHPNWTKWHRDPKNSGGGLFDLHLHDIDAMTFLFGAVSRVYAMGWQSETGCYNHVVSALTFKNGVNTVVEGAFDMTENYPFTMSLRVVGETKTAEYAMDAGFNLENISSSRRDLFIYENGKLPRKENIDVTEDAYQTELDYFTKCVENNEPTTIITPEQSREVIRVILAVQQSIETKKAIDL
jgi:predicted dehydrogenase